MIDEMTTKLDRVQKQLEEIKEQRKGWETVKWREPNPEVMRQLNHFPRLLDPHTPFLLP